MVLWEPVNKSTLKNGVGGHLIREGSEENGKMELGESRYMIYVLQKRGTERGVGAEGGVCGVRIAFVALLVPNWNRFQYACRLVGVIQLERKTDGTGRRAGSLSPCEPGEWEI